MKDYLGRTDVDAPATKTARLVECSGPAGRRAPNELAESDPDAADVLLKIEAAATQRRFARAFDDGEVNADEVTSALRKYDGLNANGKDTVDNLLSTTGDDGADLVTNADGETLRILADGSGSIDQSYRRGVARAADGDSIDSYKQLDRAVRKVDDLDGTQQRRAKQLIAETDGAGVRLVDELDGDGLQRVPDLSLAVKQPARPSEPRQRTL
jgi:hypothetical protein